MGALPDALSLETGLFINLANLHEDHRSREKIELLADQEAREILDEEGLVIRPIDYTDGLSAHVSLFFDELFQRKFHGEVTIIFCVNDEHWLNKNYRVGIIDILLNLFGGF